jgi:hypothetical protein
LLEKALKITDKQQTIVGEKGWFSILEFLSRYRSELQDKLYPANVSGGAVTLKTKEKEYFAP